MLRTTACKVSKKHHFDSKELRQSPIPGSCLFLGYKLRLFIIYFRDLGNKKFPQNLEYSHMQFQSALCIDHSCKYGQFKY